MAVATLISDLSAHLKSPEFLATAPHPIHPTASTHQRKLPLPALVRPASSRSKQTFNDVLVSIEDLSGSGFADNLAGDASNNDLYGASGNGTLYGDAGSDVLAGDLGDDAIDGGSDTNLARFSGNHSDYSLTQTASGWTISSATEGTDTLQNIERLMFADTRVGLDVNGAGGQAYRIYQAAFNRTPDAGGLGYWMSKMDEGADLVAVAQGIVNSDEFKALHGSNPTNAEIVNKFYDNVLHRPAEPDGFNYWLGELDKGVSVAQVLASFSESAEYQASSAGVISNGFHLRASCLNDRLPNAAIASKRTTALPFFCFQE